MGNNNLRNYQEVGIGVKVEVKVEVKSLKIRVAIIVWKIIIKVEKVENDCWFSKTYSLNFIFLF